MSTAIIARVGSGRRRRRVGVAGRAAAQLAHDVVGGHAFRQLEATAHARQRVVDVLAQDDAAAVQLDLELRALGQAQRVAHGFGQRDLPALGDGGFHGALPFQ